ncbi:MAG: iron-containing alcohol dehydrogenase [Planctomycetota bacterium]|nr:iron-containing alcohol dehydrogenase [Planctomycetota bacterium]
MSKMFHFPTRVMMHVGAIRALPAELDVRGMRHVLLVTDRNLAAANDLPNKVAALLGPRCAAVYDGVVSEPTLDHVQEGHRLTRNAVVDGIVSVGGGSVIDCAKGIAATMRAKTSLKPGGASFFLEGPAPSHFAIPTTAGSGSEVSAAAMLFDPASGRKSLYFDPYITPRMAILDAELTVSMPPKLTATAGLDALCHSVEALVSKSATPFSNALAHESMGVIIENLSVCCEDGGNVKAREAMLIAASMAGAAFVNAGLGIIHSLAHAIGAVTNMPHGTLCGALLPHCVRFNVAREPESCAPVAHAMGIDTSHLGPRMACEAASAAVDRLVEKLGLPTKLRDVGVKREDFPRIAELALVDPCLKTNPRAITRADELLPLMESAY